MLYKKNGEKALSADLFRNPTSEYRGTPFWAWNSRLEKDELCRQIDIFKEMGLGGFHMHVRTGLENIYLSDEYMDLVRCCTDKAKSENMLAWLYDEDRWPSGAAGGIVTRNHAYRQRSVVFSPDYGKTVARYARESGKEENGDDLKLLTCYDIVLNSEGYLVSYDRIGKDDEAKGRKWYLFLWVETDDSWYNDNAYIDTLNPAAVEEFVRVTHERYRECVGDEFDATVPAIFTDEPQVSRKEKLTNSTDAYRDISMPFTDRLPEIYAEKYGVDIFDYLPEIIWQLPDDRHSPHRYRYHDLIAELFCESFAGVTGKWCERNNIALTGHLMEEPSLESQTHSLSEAMRSYKYFGIPGIDMLCNNTELTTAKQCQSAVHQYGKEGMLSELYGVTSWDCDFRTYKYGGDWQAALGVTVRVPHLSWYAMQGAAKRDYPASISFQSPWYKKYNLVEDHFARLNTALTRGKPVVRVGVIHPVESFWIEYGPNDKTAIFRKQLEEQFFGVTDWLLEGSIDFDFICESTLPEQCPQAGSPLKVGCMEYDAIVVPGCETLRGTTVERLEKFRQDGGKLIFMGSEPKYVDAVENDAAAQLWSKSERIGFTRGELINALRDYRTLTIRRSDGELTDRLIYQLRQDNDCRWLFICRSGETDNRDISRSEDTVITVRGEYKAEIYDTQTGDIKPAQVGYSNGDTVISHRFYEYDSLLLRLETGKQESSEGDGYPDMEDAFYVKKCEDFEIDEDNVLLLDSAQYRTDEGEWQPEEEILRLDNKARAQLGIRERGGSCVQPWTVEDVPAGHTISLRFSFLSEIDYEGADLALEDAAKAIITFNGESVSNETHGFFTDTKIERVSLPVINKGLNTLEVTLPLGERTNTENMFVLGKFGVRVFGRKAKIVKMPESIDFGDLTAQGFPFYGGNIIYKFKAQSQGGSLTLTANRYRGALMSVSVDGKEAGDIIYPPYTLTVNGVEDGLHDIGLKLYIHRYNCFGPVHLQDDKRKWHGPDAWCSEGDAWAYEYNLRTTGVLAAPRIK